MKAFLSWNGGFESILSDNVTLQNKKIFGNSFQKLWVLDHWDIADNKLCDIAPEYLFKVGSMMLDLLKRHILIKIIFHLKFLTSFIEKTF